MAAHQLAWTDTRVLKVAPVDRQETEIVVEGAMTTGRHIVSLHQITVEMAGSATGMCVNGVDRRMAEIATGPGLLTAMGMTAFHCPSACPPRSQKCRSSSQTILIRKSGEPCHQNFVLTLRYSNFVTHVERAFKDRGIRTDILVLNSRLPEHAVVRRQVAEGVMAVSKLTRASQQTVRIPLQVFDRRGGSNNVQFQEYADLEPTVAAEIIHRQKQAAGYSTSYSAPSQYQATPQYGAAPPAQPQQADAAKLLSTLNPQELQKLLAQAGIQQPAQAPQGTAASPTQWGQPQAQAQGFNQLAALLAGQGQQQPAQTQAGGPNMSEIMAQLARYKR